MDSGSDHLEKKASHTGAVVSENDVDTAALVTGSDVSHLDPQVVDQLRFVGCRFNGYLASPSNIDEKSTGTSCPLCAVSPEVMLRENEMTQFDSYVSVSHVPTSMAF